MGEGLEGAGAWQNPGLGGFGMPAQGLVAPSSKDWGRRGDVGAQQSLEAGVWRAHHIALWRIPFGLCGEWLEGMQAGAPVSRRLQWSRSETRLERKNWQRGGPQKWNVQDQ